MDTIAIRSNGVARAARRASSCISRKSAEPRATKAVQAFRTHWSRLLAHAENRERVFQRLRLIFQRLRGRRGLFHQRRVLLRDLVHLRDGGSDLADAPALLAG